MGRMQKKIRLKLSLNVFEGKRFSKGDQQDFPKMGQIMFLIRWCSLTGFS
jgi:hypothetical protein